MARLNTPQDGPLQAALLETTTAAASRATEGQKIFSPIAVFWINIAVRLMALHTTSWEPLKPSVML
jgi:hypothetical protein